jgi:hypothetical protein
MMIKVHTSCGHVFRQSVHDLSRRQLEGLLEQNEHRTDLTKADRHGLAAMRKELDSRMITARRERAVMGMVESRGG